ncbi:MAG: energy transducer TonB [Sediminibacterium sp.]|nr:energy transducer TonB [uncultured Sediminibacterium sp.]
MLKSRCAILCLLIFSSVIGYAQNGKEAFFAFREDWSPINNINLATYFMHRVKENDTTYVCRFYRLFGPMVKCETYKDEKLEIPHGRFVWYNEQGLVDSLGMVSNGKKDRYWDFKAADGKLTMSVLFDKGKRVWTKDYVSQKTFYADGTVEDHNAPKKDTVEAKKVTVVQTPAEFKGGIQGWTRYLEKNLKTPERFKSVVGNGGKGTVVVLFTIDTEGKVTDLFIDRSIEWSVDMESLRVIKESPRWKPASQNGKNVLYRHKQNITHSIY